ncbi:hypothetical protein K7G98_23030, partial [Saccharothrix sp. MB29]|nr:hypothetical protein [Saccharothrix sp. MB29]
MITRRVLGGLAAVLTLVLLGSTLTSAGQPKSDWPSWQKDLAGSRHNAAEWKLNPATVGKLKLKWAFAYPREELD